jgi:hypothetical protein
MHTHLLHCLGERLETALEAALIVVIGSDLRTCEKKQKKKPSQTRTHLVLRVRHHPVQQKVLRRVDLHDDLRRSHLDWTNGRVV